ncbi:hypothetical protein BJX66DRAFT_315398 [Aspergillus keveii]|uniref:SMP-30/Gluconolactonase/LRE-like region domain-containing protein n=1 Tax=Aspergillus keveii TaxID=714993 RepID=A0ABR4FPH4_9EURO
MASSSARKGTLTQPSTLVYMEASAPYKTTVLLDNFHSRRFNSINDVVIHSDGSIWFTDPPYYFEQGFRPESELSTSSATPIGVSCPLFTRGNSRRLFALCSGLYWHIAHSLDAHCRPAG